MEYGNVQFGKEIKFWCYLMVTVAAINILGCALLKDYFSMVTCIAAGVLYYWLMIGRKRLTFYLILVLFSVLILSSVLIKVNLLAAVVRHGIPPFITFILLKKYWPFMK